MTSMSRRLIKVVEEILSSTMGLDASSIGQHDIPKAIIQRMAINKDLTDEEYIHHIQNDPKEVQELIELIVVPETWFFRNKSSFTYFSELVQKLDRKGRPLRILSFPCASGEEPYSIAMTLVELGLDANDFSIEGVDLSEHLIAEAEIGIYHNRCFRNQNLEMRDKYFCETDEGYEINSSIKDVVRLRHGNILDDHMELSHISYDVIFCRNLFIYLNLEAQEKAIANLFKLLKKEGVLFVGPGEGELFRRHGFHQIRYPHAFAFHKGKKVIKLKNKVTFQPSIPDIKKVQKVVQSVMSDLDRAKQKADSGNLDEAKVLCERFIDSQGASEEAFFLLALIFHAMGEEENARDNFQKVIYLNPDHYEALFHLSLLAEMMGDDNKKVVFQKRAEQAKKRKENS